MIYEPPLFIRSIQQSNSHRFTIEWTDGKISEYKFSDLQKVCTCARCRDELSGEMQVDPVSVSVDVEGIRIVSVGRYALQITFSSGCSKGIYSFKFLRRLN